VYDNSETSATLLATAQLYLGSEHAINHYTNDSGFETQWEQHLDPVCPPPPLDVEVLRSAVPASYHDYLDVFSPKLADRLPDYGPHDFSIDLITDAPLPKKLKPYRQPPLLHELGCKYVADLLSKGYTRESKSPIAAPLMYIPKKDSD
jgi:hypothetical protein